MVRTIDSDTATALHVGAGSSGNEDARAAAAEAVAHALGGRTPQAGDLVFVFADVVHDAAQVMDTVVATVGPATAIGCSSQGSFTTGTAGPHAVSVVYVPGGDLVSGIAAESAPDGDLYRASRDAAKRAKQLAGDEHPHSVLVVFSNHTGAQRDVVRGAYEITGARVPLVGGAAASNPQMDPTWQAVGNEIIGDGVTAVWLNSPRPIGVALDHGWKPISKPLLVTRASGNVVLELDGRPAVEAYLEARGRPAGSGDLPFGWEAIDLPFGLPTIGGGYEVRHIWDQTEEGGLEMFGYIHDQAVVRVMTGVHDELLDGARRAVRRAVSQLDGPARGALVFSCTARLVLFGDRVDDERAVIGDELGGAQAGGFFTTGEYARTTGSTGFHNASVAVLVL